jgi:hypothetical protein
LYRLHPSLTLMMVISVGATFAAASVGKYAVAPRLLIFLAPVVALLTAAGAIRLVEQVQCGRPWVAVSMAAIWCLNANNTFAPFHELKPSRSTSASHDFAAVFQTLRAAEPHNAVYVDPDSGPAFEIASLQSRNAPSRVYASGTEIHWSSPASLRAHVSEFISACGSEVVDLLINDGRASAYHIAMIETLLAQHGQCHNLGVHGGIVVLRYEPHPSAR